MHVDIDAFYASVEQLDDPALRERPVVVGALPGSRGVVSSCSYDARQYGVRSAMPISEAYRRCRQAAFRPVRMKRYAEVSERIMRLLQNLSPDFQQVSIDEASLELTGTQRLHGPPDEMARRVKNRILGEVGLTISIGIAPNRYLAKLASEYDKPDGLWIVEAGQEEQFLNGLDLHDLWGIGQKTLSNLRAAGITTVTELRAVPQERLCDLFGPGSGGYLYSVARGLDTGLHAAHAKSRSLSSEVTFEKDTKDAGQISRVLLNLSHELMNRMLRDQCRSRTVFIKLRLHDFSTSTARKTLKHCLVSAEEIHTIACELLDAKWDHSQAVRLVGVGVSLPATAEGAAQLDLFEDDYERKRKVEATVRTLRERLTGVKITKGSLLSLRRGRDRHQG